ncbi:tigger transposable element-derived protein 6-like [Anthonomus grandis grandis]|uniref:tigger transposable element-derived protein 6-like n=1 Tax=Anthonomus grandis grandis TaxID=2921223 RepID=UPI0021654177|nr:tigger transposable element-derived protein 6-like [Anthonomus grandis grandis]
MAPKKRMLSLKEKMEVVNVLDRESVSVRHYAKRFNIGKTQATEIAKNKENIRSKWQSGTNINQKKDFLKKEGFAINKTCFEWFVKARSQNIPISGPLVKIKAKEIAITSGYNNFSASDADGWLQKWRKRHSVSFKCISGKAAAVNQVDVSQYLEKLPSMLLGYKPEDVYNADESGLFFRALPDKTLCLKGETCVGGKLSKDRLTILFCANMAGEKCDLIVIGKAAHPRALKNVAIKDLPASWKSNKKAWMTREIMSEWLLEFDRKMGIQKRTVFGKVGFRKSGCSSEFAEQNYCDAEDDLPLATLAQLLRHAKHLGVADP